MTCEVDTLLDGLTDAQRGAVAHLDGPLLVLAGPGSGKTTVVTRRVAHLVSHGIPPWQILGLTFTNKAAGEMRDRVEPWLPPDLPGLRGLTIATFHAFCARLLRRYADVAGLATRFSIYDSADQRAAIKQAITAADLSVRNFSPAAVAAEISNAKNRLLDAAGYAAEARDFFTRSMARAYTAYESALRASDALDFDDLLLVTARILRTHEAVRGELQERYQYVLVDEYQDTNHAQFVIASTIAAAHRNFCVVGDPDQSIYGWRGADIRNILEFEQQYPEATVIPLGQNFRSTGHVVAVADHLIRHNTRRKHKPLHTELGDGEKPSVVVCGDEFHEARTVVDEFRRRHDENGVAWKDMAVLYRMNALSRVLEEVFRDAQIPYVIARGTAFYDRKEIKDALSYLRLIANPNDEVSLRRIINTPVRGIGRTTLDRVELHALDRGLRFFEALREAGRIDGFTARQVTAIDRFVKLVDGWRAAVVCGPGGGPAGSAGDGAAVPSDAVPDPLAALVERVVRESGMEKHYKSSANEEDLERLANLEELISAAAQFEPLGDPETGDPNTLAEIDSTGSDGGDDATRLDLLEAYLESVALVSDADVIDPANGAVTLLTLHAAKGLEFDVVAIVGLEQGLLPHYRATERATERDRELEEERRLCFVGITRAKRWLLLTRSTVRTHRGLRERAAESQFLRELPAGDITSIDRAEDAWLAADADAWSDGFDSRSNRRGGAGLGEFPKGALVRHPQFGVGRVDAVMPRPVGASARVTFETVGTKTLILEYAKLERIG